MRDDGGKTACDLVREFIPGADDEFVDYVLWEKTPFPMGTEDEIREALTAFTSAPGNSSLGRVDDVAER